MRQMWNEDPKLVLDETVAELQELRDAYFADK